MHNKMAAVAICIAAFAMSAAAQTVNRIPKYITSSTFGDSVITELNGNVGIGTTNPGELLEIMGSTPRLKFRNTVDGYAAQAMGLISNGLSITSDAGNSLFVQRMTGNVGIGTTSPGAKLEVSGSVKLTSGSGGSITFQDGTTQSTAYTGVICGGDYAESVDVTGDRKHYEPGDVLVIDPSAPGKFLKSNQPYSTLVTGIYSTKPGTVGRRQTTSKSPDEVPMAMMGIVPTKVTAENGPIKTGDLLVASSTMGRAMKGTDRSLLTGAVIGKALGNLDSGTGVIEVVVTLQ